MVTGSTLTEVNASPKVGSGNPPMGFNPSSASLNRVRVDSGGQALTTNQGVRVSDNQNSLKAGVRGPALLEDFILREKITHFDHERIPERIVHARGSGAHGYFECNRPLSDLTQALCGSRETHAGLPRLLLIEEERVPSAVTAFAQALAQHRHFSRETDPPRV
jgi:catalase